MKIYFYKMTPAQLEKGGTEPPLAGRWCVVLYLNIQMSLTKFFGVMHCKFERKDRMKYVFDKDEKNLSTDTSIDLSVLVICRFTLFCFVYQDKRRPYYFRPFLLQQHVFKLHDQMSFISFWICTALM